MRSDTLLKIAHYFESLASEEKLPKNSKDLDVIKENLDKLENYKSRKEYAEKNLKHLSSGSSRIVYLTPDKTVLKLAKNEKGIAQNKVEANPKMKSKFINEIIDKSKDFIWIETHFLDKITEKEFEELTGISFKDFADAIDNPDNSSKKAKKFELYKEMERLADDFDLATGDISRISSWGKKDKHPVLIDAGLSEKVYSDYYKSSSSS